MQKLAPGFGIIDAAPFLFFVFFVAFCFFEPKQSPSVISVFSVAGSEPPRSFGIKAKLRQDQQDGQDEFAATGRGINAEPILDFLIS